MINKIFKKKKVYEHYVAVCCIVKNEGLYFNEWLNYHLSIGISHFYIYDNESDVPATQVLKEYIQKGQVTVQTIAGKEKQTYAFSLCLQKHGPKCRWIAFIDVDEYIVPKTTLGNLPKFLSAYEKFGGLGISWLVFGSNNHVNKPAGLQVESYTRRSLKNYIENDHIKSIVQPEHVFSIAGDPHHFLYKKKYFCVNENFERLEGPRNPHTSDKIQLNHYFLRSFEEFKTKVSRGRADLDVPRKLQEFHDIDKDANRIADETIVELKILMEADAAKQVIAPNPAPQP